MRATLETQQKSLLVVVEESLKRMLQEVMFFEGKSVEGVDFTRVYRPSVTWCEVRIGEV